ncbi:hypothetical protein Y1Q_0010586 [Alligator mississippiensis]|uniref:Ig-like domain-containing protein n=1 Tax=Alligator mississippiensis TaxID=8496 RepID=A0A151PGF4_ALLMI|nr:hypothetical protein Y1Q_0010586 [Alligator mississippiensis]
METSLILGLFMAALYPGAARGDSVQSQEPHVSAAEGHAVTLRCSYTTSYVPSVYLYWYRRYPDRPLQFILYKGSKEAGSVSNTADFVQGRFSSQVINKTTLLTISALELADTAVYYCAIQRAQRGGDKRELYKNPPACMGRGPEKRPQRVFSDRSIVGIPSSSDRGILCDMGAGFPSC